VFPPISQLALLLGLGCVSAPDTGANPTLDDESAGLSLNTPPVISAITLSPGEVPTDGLIAASVEVGDVEGDDVILRYEWRVDGVLLDTSGSLLDGEWWFDKGQNVTVQVTPFDDGGAGEPVSAGGVSVVNSPPTAPILSLSDSPKAGLEELLCAVLVPASDLDEDALSYRFTWWVDGEAFEGAVDGEWPGDTVPASAIQPYTDWRCEVSASDGEAEGPAVSLEVSAGIEYSGWESHDVELAAAEYTFTGARAYDQSGYALAGAGDIDGDGLADLIIGAPDSDAGPDDGGAAYLVTGASLRDGVTGDLGDRPALLGPGAESYAGSAVASLGDVDGDGLGDVIIGAPGAGAAFLLRGSVALSEDDLDLSADAERLVGVGGDGAGNSVAGAGDVDGDGLDDVLVGAYWDDDGGHKAGRTYLVSGASLGPSKVALADADASWSGEGASNWSGYALDGVGDVDGDGLDDVLIGAPYNDDAGFRAGKSYLVLGSSVSGWGELSQADHVFRGEADEDNSGAAVAGAGDIDGDGRADLLISAEDNDAGKVSAGRTYLVLAGDLEAADSLRGAWAITGEGENLSSGSDVAGVGDLDGDGLGEILVGAVGSDNYRGGAYLLFGAWFDHHDGELTLSQAEYLFAGERSGDFAGYAVAGPGDVDGDGRPDLLIGAYASDDAGESAGKSYLVLAP